MNRAEHNLSHLDQAILAYRENPTEENKQTVLYWQALHTEAFYRSQATQFIAQGKGETRA